MPRGSAHERTRVREERITLVCNMFCRARAREQRHGPT